MRTEKHNTVMSFMIILLLFIQVMLSFFIMKKLNETNETVNYLEQKFIPAQNLAAPNYVENVSTDDDPWLGTEAAPITIVEFADYQCPACAAAVPITETILEKYEGKVRFVYRDFPLNSHQYAFQAAEAAQCAGEQGHYWEMYNTLFSHQDNLDIEALENYAANLGLDTHQFNECLKDGKYVDEVEYDIAEALGYQVMSTPTFFVNGHRIIGANSVELEQKIIELLGE